MKTKPSIHRWAVLVAASGLFTVLASGCITHPPGGSQQRVDTSKETTTVPHRRQSITHPPGRDNDVSKDSPAPPKPGLRRMMSTPPPTITHPGG